jgi:hypothetical protein
MRQRLIGEHLSQISVLADHVGFAADLLQHHVDDARRHVATVSPVAFDDLILAYNISCIFATILILEEVCLCIDFVHNCLLIE